MKDKPTHIRWLVFAILALGSFISYVLRANVSIAAPTMIKDLALSEIQWGWVLAAFTAGGIVNTGANAMGVINALLVPWFADTFGWKVAIASGAGFALLGAALLLFVRADRPLPS